LTEKSFGNNWLVAAFVKFTFIEKVAIVKGVLKNICYNYIKLHFKIVQGGKGNEAFR
jgi:hypothetical protein